MSNIFTMQQPSSELHFLLILPCARFPPGPSQQLTYMQSWGRLGACRPSCALCVWFSCSCRDIELPTPPAYIP